MVLPIQPLSQRDSRWASQRLGTVNSTTLGSHGCVVTSMAMLATYYNHPILPNQLDDILTDRGFYYDGNLFVNDSITKIFSDVKFDKVVWCETVPAPIDEIKKYLDAKKPVVVSLINQGIRHFVLAVGYEGNQIIVNDPWMGDQVNVNDRWGDSASKILQVNFFSGPVTKKDVPVDTKPTPSTVTTPTINDQTKIDLGGDLGILELQAIRSEIIDLKRDKQNLEIMLENVRNDHSSMPMEIGDQTRIDLGPNLGTMEVQSIRSEILDLRRNNSSMERALLNLQNEIENLEHQLTEIREDKYGNLPITGPVVSPTIPANPGGSFTDRLKSRKLILSVIASAIPLVNSSFNLGLNTEQLMTVIGPLLAYVGVEGLADVVERGTSSIKNLNVPPQSSISSVTTESTTKIQ